MMDIWWEWVTLTKNYLHKNIIAKLFSDLGMVNDKVISIAMDFYFNKLLL